VCPDSLRVMRRPQITTATTTACSKVRSARFGAGLSADAWAYSAKVPLPDAEHLIAGLEPCHIHADRLHEPGRVRARDLGLWRP